MFVTLAMLARRACLGLAVALWAAGACSYGAVAVVSNRTSAPLVAKTTADDNLPSGLMLAPGDSRPVFGLESLTIEWSAGDESRTARLTPGCAYFFAQSAPGQPIELEQIGLNDRPGPPLVLPGGDLLAVATPTLKVRALVDDDEPRRAAAWEPALRARLAAASDVIEAHCGVRLELVGFDAWDSDNDERDFFRTLAEFEREVAPVPGGVAIGFSSQYAVERGRYHLGGTRAPLHTHILLKERAQGILNTERLELLVHELGHLLGAVHSPEATSVMRPLLVGGLQREAGARVQFDPVNTLAMSLVADEMRLRRISSISDATALTRRRLAEIYAAIDPTLPEDPAAAVYQRLVGSAAAGPIVEDARKVIAQIERVAQFKEQALANIAEQAQAGGSDEGDRLLEWYVRQAAAAALRVRKEHAEKAFLLAIGTALDDQGMLTRLPTVSGVERQLSPDAERRRRAEIVGEPTMRGRRDLAKHFFVSAHLVVILGSDGARDAGLLKEVVDSHGGSGFSFVDLMADRAGIVFAHAVLGGRISLERIAREFTVAAVLPTLEDLPEGLQAAEFSAGFGGPTDPRLQSELQKIEVRVGSLPIYGQAP
ncbi:MAG: hypothetical protein KF688_01645 [Pirellulales bacterium]|nr:hypothetical protein [Pirellulales bacterium]